MPEGDHIPRHVCDACHTVHYRNPLLVVGAVATWENRILMCKRAIEPRRGFWTVPAGFMENDETMQEAAARETQEEALAKIEVGDMFAAINVLRVNQVHVMFLARMSTPEFGAGDESLESRLMLPEEIPWPELAFPSISYTLERYVEDLGRRRFGMHVADIRGPQPRG